MPSFCVNLLPWRQRRLAQDTRRWWLWLLFFTGVLSLTLGTCRWTLTQQRSVLEDRLRTVQQEQHAYSVQLREVQWLMAALRREHGKQQADDKTRAHNRGYEQLLTQLAQLLPDGLWLTAMTAQDGKVNLRGKGHDYADIVHFSSRLETETVLTSVRLIQTRQETISSSDSTLPALVFHLQADGIADRLSQPALPYDELPHDE